MDPAAVVVVVIVVVAVAAAFRSGQSPFAVDLVLSEKIVAAVVYFGLDRQ